MSDEQELPELFLVECGDSYEVLEQGLFPAEESAVAWGQTKRGYPEVAVTVMRGATIVRTFFIERR